MLPWECTGSSQVPAWVAFVSYKIELKGATIFELDKVNQGGAVAER